MKAVKKFNRNIGKKYGRRVKKFVKDVESEAFPHVIPKFVKSFVRTTKEEIKKDNVKTIELLNTWEVIKAFVIAQIVIMKGSEFASNVAINMNFDAKYICAIKDGAYNKTKNPHVEFCKIICKYSGVSKEDSVIICAKLINSL